MGSIFVQPANVLSDVFERSTRAGIGLSWQIMFGLTSLLVCWDIVGCVGPKANDSDLLLQLLGDSSAQFRGVLPGDSVVKVLRSEPQGPTHQDELGLAYQYVLSDSTSFELEYYRLPADTHLLAAMHADVFLGAEPEALRLYDALQRHFAGRYGTPSGVFGALEWTAALPPNAALGADSFVVGLKLHKSKSSLVLTFTPLWDPEAASQPQ
jgi:hypothetical protein